jgi:peptide/nickel transport system substrate-binding protein
MDALRRLQDYLTLRPKSSRVLRFLWLPPNSARQSIFSKKEKEIDMYSRFRSSFQVVFALLMILALTACGAPAAGPAAEQPAAAGESQLPVQLPRNELFVADQIFRYSVTDNFNLWVAGPHNPHRHAYMYETLWYREQETGERLFGVAISDPMYNDDYTQMNVDLRDNIYWSDGVQFTADDLVYTVEMLMGNSGLNSSGWSASLTQFVSSVEKTGDFSVQFNLNQPNPRFHSLFETRWNGVYMMPKHVFEGVEDPVTFTFNPPVSLGAYVVTETDPNGYWELYTRRDDWERTPAGIIVGKPGPKYVLTIFYGDSAKKAIAMSRGELDVFFDVDYEAFQTVLETTPTARSWYTDFPWAYPNEIDVRHLAFNVESDPIYGIKDVRWALALALDIVELQTEYIGGVAKVTYAPIPPTANLAAMYLDSMEEWAQNLEIEVEPGEMYKPYDPTVPDRIAAWAEEQGYTVPGTPSEVFGTGWWNFDPEVAERLLLKHGFSRDSSGNWLKPDGTPWRIDLQSPPDENDAFRMATAAADMWSDFGIEVNLLGLERSVFDQNHVTGTGYQISTPWYSFVLADGDSWPQTRTRHPDLYMPIGEDYRAKGGSNHERVNDPKVGEFIDAMVPLEPGSPENQEVVQEFLQYWAEQMYTITAISFKKFVTWDERYWTGFPTAEQPDYMPLYWFHGGKFAIQSLEPVE